MEAPTAAARVLRFGIFELDVQSGELRRHGLKVRLPDQAFQILRLLLARPGDVVTREELRQQLWTSDTFVDFDLGLNSAVRKLREALDDSAEQPAIHRDTAAAGLPVHRTGDNRRRTDPMVESAAGGTTATGARGRLKWIAGGLVLAGHDRGARVVSARMVGPGACRCRKSRRRIAGGARSARRRAIDPAANEAYLKGVAAAGLADLRGAPQCGRLFRGGGRKAAGLCHGLCEPRTGAAAVPVRGSAVAA